MNENNIFSAVVGKKRELLSLLEQATKAIKSGEIEPNNIVFETSPGAYDRGLVDQKEFAFFGFSFTKGSPKNKSMSTPPSMAVVEAMDSSKKEVHEIFKITDRQAEMFKVGINYNCDCGWTTSSVTGFKKHFNKCKKRAQTWDILNTNLEKRGKN